MASTRSPAVVVFVAAVLLNSCSQADDGSEGGLCPAAVVLDGVMYNADSRFGTPVDLGEPIEGVTTVKCGRTGGEPVAAVAIAGIPTDVAFYAPEANGQEFIVIRERTSLTKQQLTRLSRG